MKGLRLYLPPFAPDQSGAVSVLYRLGGLIVICDAGGCTGNICGFDEPRWFQEKSAIFSAGLRDMDAILGRDDRLISKLGTAARQIDAKFAAIIGTPVPAVIGTDYQALKHMAENELHMPVLTIDTNGTRLYDEGAAKAFLSLFAAFAVDSAEPGPDTFGILGATPLDLEMACTPDLLLQMLKERGCKHVLCHGMDGSVETIAAAGKASRNFVLSPVGLTAAQFLQKKFGTPYECFDPTAAAALRQAMQQQQISIPSCWKKILILHQQIRANTLRQYLRTKLPDAQITVATWFMTVPEDTLPQDTILQEEEDFQQLVQENTYDCIIGDALFQRAIPDFTGTYLMLPHFAVSGRA